MSYNKSLDFLEMIKNTAGAPADNNIKSAEKANRTVSHERADNCIAVIDTETNWYDDVMSVGVALADAKTYKCTDAKYYIIDPAFRTGGMYSNVLGIAKSVKSMTASRDDVMDDICNYLQENNVKSIFAYNAKFDYGHLDELKGFDWFDIMRLAAYTQYNAFIPADAQVCKTGRLKKGYSVECILRMLSGDISYNETHNAVYDAIDELKIMEFLGHDLETYDICRL